MLSEPTYKEISQRLSVPSHSLKDWRRKLLPEDAAEMRIEGPHGYPKVVLGDTTVAHLAIATGIIAMGLRHKEAFRIAERVIEEKPRDCTWGGWAQFGHAHVTVDGHGRPCALILRGLCTVPNTKTYLAIDLWEALKPVLDLLGEKLEMAVEL